MMVCGAVRYLQLASTTDFTDPKRAQLILSSVSHTALPFATPILALIYAYRSPSKPDSAGDYILETLTKRHCGGASAASGKDPVRNKNTAAVTIHPGRTQLDGQS